MWTHVPNLHRPFCCENARKTVVKCYGNPGRDESSALPKVCYPSSAKFGCVYTINETSNIYCFNFSLNMFKWKGWQIHSKRFKIWDLPVGDLLWKPVICLQIDSTIIHMLAEVYLYTPHWCVLTSLSDDLFACFCLLQGSWCQSPFL